MTIEIVPARPNERLSSSLRAIEGGRLSIEDLEVARKHYRKTTLVLPLPDGDSRERVVFFAEEAERVRMLGFHRIRRHNEAPEGETIVFNPGEDNPLHGVGVSVPPDTHTYLSLAAALGAVTGSDRPIRAHIWKGGSDAVPIEISADGAEELAVLGTKMKTRRMKVRPTEGGEPEAIYWFAEQSPHSFLQYRGPGDLLTEGGEETAPVVLRATSSSEQVDRIFGGP